MNNLKDLKFEPIPGITSTAISNSSSSSALLAAQLNTGPEQGRTVTLMRDVRLPIVCILNGTGGSGKDTFSQLCRDVGLGNSIHISTITGVKKAAELLINFDNRDCARDAVENKDEAYRLFLHNMKMAWSEFNNGSTRYVCNYIRDTIQDTISDNIVNPVVIFVDVREPEEIEKLKKALLGLGIIAVSVLIEGLVDPASHQNYADNNVENYQYDYVVTNRPGELDKFQDEARVFTAKVLEFFYSDSYTSHCHAKCITIDHETK